MLKNEQKKKVWQFSIIEQVLTNSQTGEKGKGALLLYYKGCRTNQTKSTVVCSQQSGKYRNLDLDPPLWITVT